MNYSLSIPPHARKIILCVKSIFSILNCTPMFFVFNDFVEDLFLLTKLQFVPKKGSFCCLNNNALQIDRLYDLLFSERLCISHIFFVYFSIFCKSSWKFRHCEVNLSYNSCSVWDGYIFLQSRPPLDNNKVCFGCCFHNEIVPNFETFSTNT